jgi:AcrR family transcriptional regulator
MDIDSGRSQQKYRTRRALLAAAKSLADRKLPVTVQAAADEAGISRATAYRYFASSEYLLREALLDAEWTAPEVVVGDASDIRERVRRVQAYLFDFTSRNEMAHRHFLAKALDAWVQQAGKATAPLRGARRLPMYEHALEPARKRLTPSQFKRLVQQLSAASGIETFIALKDVCGASDSAARVIAEANVMAILDDALKLWKPRPQPVKIPRARRARPLS